MKELADGFKEEQNHFRRCMLVYDYVEFLNSEQLIKELLGELFVESNNKIEEEPEIQMPDDEESFMRSKIGWENNFWVYYANFLYIHGLMVKFKFAGKNRIEALEQIEHAMARSYATDLLETSFKIVNDKIFEKLGQKEFLIKPQKITGTQFDEEKSVLYIKGEPVLINERHRINNFHKILRHIFVTNSEDLFEEFYYSDIAIEEFGDLEYSHDSQGWKRYYDACGKLQRKIGKNTKNNIENFLIFSAGKSGCIKINPQYL